MAEAQAIQSVITQVANQATTAVMARSETDQGLVSSTNTSSLEKYTKIRWTNCKRTIPYLECSGQVGRIT